MLRYINNRCVEVQSKFARLLLPKSNSESSMHSLIPEISHEFAKYDLQTLKSTNNVKYFNGKSLCD